MVDKSEGVFDELIIQEVIAVGYVVAVKVRWYLVGVTFAMGNAKVRGTRVSFGVLW